MYRTQNKFEKINSTWDGQGDSPEGNTRIKLRCKPEPTSNVTNTSRKNRHYAKVARQIPSTKSSSTLNRSNSCVIEAMKSRLPRIGSLVSKRHQEL